MMSDFKDWLSRLPRELATLPSFARIAFGASCCERQLANYEAFARDEKLDKTNPLTSALDEIWNVVKGSTRDPARLNQLLKTCEESIPDTTEHRSSFTSAALDTSTSVAETLEYLLDDDVTHLVTVASLARDSIDLFIQHRDSLDYSDPLFEQRIATDPLMSEELSRQREDLQTLKCCDGRNGQLLRDFMGRARSIQTSTLGLPVKRE